MKESILDRKALIQDPVSLSLFLPPKRSSSIISVSHSLGYKVKSMASIQKAWYEVEKGGEKMSLLFTNNTQAQV